MAANQNLLVQLLITAKDQATSAFGKMFSALNDSTNVIATHIRAAFTDLFGGGVAGAAAFEEQLSKVQAKGDESYQDLARLKGGLSALAAQFGITGEEAARGMEVLAAAGLSAEDAFKALPAVLNLAKLEGLSLDAAATKLSDSLAIVGLGFGEAARMADVLAKGANISTSSAASLAEALAVAGGIAKSAGLDLEQTVAALNLLHSAGIKGSAAGTSLAAILTQLQNPASAASKELNALGISSRDLGEVIEALSGRGAGANKAILAFGETAGPGLRGLIGQGSAGLTDFTEQLRNAEGAAQTAADQVSLNFNTALSRLGAAWDNVKSALTEPVLEPLAAAAQKAAAVLNDTLKSGALEPLQKAIGKFATEGLAAVRAFVESFDFKGALASLNAFVTTASESFGSIRTAGVVTADALKTAWNAVQTAFYGAAAGLSAIATGFVGTVNTFVTALNAAGLASDELKGKADSALLAMQDRTRELADAAQTNLGEAAGAFQSLLKNIEPVPPALRALKDELPSGEIEALAAEVEAYADALKNAQPGTELAAYYAERLRLAQEGLARAQRDGAAAAVDAAGGLQRVAAAAETGAAAADRYHAVWQAGADGIPRLVNAHLELAGGVADVALATGQAGERLKEWNGTLVRANDGVTVLSDGLTAINTHLETADEKIAEYNRQIQAATANAGGWSAGMELNDVKLMGLRDAATAAGEKLAYLKSIQDQLPDANRQIAQATAAATAAQNAYAVALDESIAQQERGLAAAQRLGDLEQGALDLKRNLALAEQRLAEARGDAAGASRAEAAATAAQIEKTRAAAAAKAEEIAAYEELIAATERKLAADGELSASDQARLAEMADKRAGLEQERAQLLQIAESLEKMAEAQKKSAAAADDQGRSYTRMIDAASKAQRELSELSKAAGDLAFQNIPVLRKASGGAAADFERLSEGAQEVSRQLDNVNAAIAANARNVSATTGVYGDLYKDMVTGVNAATKAFLEQAFAAEQSISRLEELAETGKFAGDEISTGAVRAAQSFSLLDQERLERLQAAIDAANAKLAAMREEADDARAAIARLDAEIAAERGETEKAALLRQQLEYQQALAELEAKQSAARAAGNRELMGLYDEQARKLAEINALKEKNIKADEAARRAQTANPATTTASAGGTGATASPAGTGAARTYNLNLIGVNGRAFPATTTADPGDFLDAIERARLRG